jgi:Flp pilus assembly protein TadD
MPVPAIPAPRRLRPLLLAVLAATALAYLPVLRNGFVWDDMLYIVENPHVAGGLTAANARWALTALAVGNWHPLTWISHMLDVQAAGLRPWWPHLVNVLLHLANTALLFAALARLTGAAGRSLLVAALFALHPLHVESVAWAAERKDVLSTFFGLLALLGYARYVRAPRAGRYLAVALAFAAALAAKPMLVTLPALLLLLDAWPLGRLRGPALRGALLEKAPLLALSAACAAVAVRAQKAAGAYGAFEPAVRLSNAVVSYVRYLRMTAVPSGLAAFYPHPLRPWPPWQTGGALLALALATALALLAARRRPWLAAGWLWYLGTLVPVIGLVQVGQQALADRYMYLPAVGLFVALAWECGDLAARWPAARPPLLAAAAAVLAALAAATAFQAATWRDTVTVFTRAARVAPGNWVAHFNLGSHYQELGRDEEAITEYRRAVAALPSYEKALNNLAVLHAGRGDFAAAEALFREAIRVSPGYEKPYNNLGVAYVSQGRLPEAEALYRRALAAKPDAVEPRLNLGRLLLKQSRWGEAQSSFAEVLRLDARSADAANGLGIALARQGRYAEALAAFREAARLAPQDREIAENLARALALAAGGR